MRCISRRLIGSLVSSAVAAMVVGCGPAPVRVRVLTYNIHHGEGVDGEFDLKRLAAVIVRCDPDLVALQEVDRATGRASGVDQAAELGRLTGMKSVFGKAMDYDGGEYGEAILTRLDLVETRNHALPHSPEREPRAALAVRVRLDSGEEITFAGTHLDHLRDETDRIAQVQRINEVLAIDPATPTILAGDLNAVPGSRPIELLSEHWVDSAANDPAATFPSKSPRRRIDYVLFRPADRWRVLDTRVIDEPVASDHAPLLTILELIPAK
jgi:endonuclease/exonuclease/phosphatase family metal-dependent hydrolase